MNPPKILPALQKGWPVIAAIAVLCAALAFVLSRLVTPQFRATATQYYTINFSKSANDLAQGSTYTSNQMISFGQLATSQIVLQPVIDKLGLATTSTSLARSIDISTPRNTVIMGITAQSSDPQQAANIANAVASQTKVVVEDYAPQMDNGESTVTVRIIEDAVPPAYQFSPNKRVNAALGGFGGVLLGTLLVIAWQYFDRRIRNSDALAEVTSVPFLGSLRTTPPGAADAVVLRDPRTPASEDYRKLRANLAFAMMSRENVQVVVSSAIPAEGKSTVATNLALVLAESSEPVLLVDADLRRPRIAQYLGLDNAVGLSTVLVGETDLDAAVQGIGETGLFVLTSGPTPPNPGEMLASKPMTDLLALLRDRYVAVVIDSPPVLAVADAASVAAQTDGIVVVTNAKRSRKGDLARALDGLKTSGVRVMGCVINDVKAQDAPRDNYGYDDIPAPGPSPRSRRDAQHRGRGRRLIRTP